MARQGGQRIAGLPPSKQWNRVFSTKMKKHWKAGYVGWSIYVFADDQRTGGPGTGSVHQRREMAHNGEHRERPEEESRGTSVFFPAIAFKRLTTQDV